MQKDEEEHPPDPPRPLSGRRVAPEPELELETIRAANNGIVESRSETEAAGTAQPQPSTATTSSSPDSVQAVGHGTGDTSAASLTHRAVIAMRMPNLDSNV